MSDSATPWTTAPQDSLSFTIFWGLLKFMSIQSVMLSNHLNLRFLICYSESLLVHRTCQALKKSGWEKQRSLGTSQAYGGDAPVIAIRQKTRDDKDRHRLLCKNKRGVLPETGVQKAPSEHVNRAGLWIWRKEINQGKKVEREGAEESRCKAWLKHPQGIRCGQRVGHEKERQGERLVGKAE